MHLHRIFRVLSRVDMVEAFTDAPSELEKTSIMNIISQIAASPTVDATTT